MRDPEQVPSRSSARLESAQETQERQTSDADTSVNSQTPNLSLTRSSVLRAPPSSFVLYQVGKSRLTKG